MPRSLADVQHLVRCSLRLGAGLVQRLERRAGELELAAGLEVMLPPVLAVGRFRAMMLSPSMIGSQP